jgi:cytochrome P460
MKKIYILSAALSIGLMGCSDQVNPRVATRLNGDAAVVGDVPSNPVRGKVITSWVDKKAATMSTLFGNDVAVQYARSNAEGKYPVGAVLSVVTWNQQEDPRWFGGKIPEKTKAVEFVTIAGPGVYSYQRYEGSPLTKVAEDAAHNDRADYLLSLRAAVMP